MSRNKEKINKIIELMKDYLWYSFLIFFLPLGLLTLYNNSFSYYWKETIVVSLIGPCIWIFIIESDFRQQLINTFKTWVTSYSKYIVATIVLLLTCISIIYFVRLQNDKSKYLDRNPVSFQESTDEKYFIIPEAQYLRTIFEESINIDNTKYKEMLSDYDKVYFSSPFIVYEENNSLAGGKQLELIFVNKPDKMFTAWVYKLATGEYDLKGFEQNTNVSDVDLKIILNKYKVYLENSKYFY